MFQITVLRNVFLTSLLFAVITLASLFLIVFPTVQDLIVQNTEEDVRRLSEHFSHDLIEDLRKEGGQRQEAQLRMTAYLSMIHRQMKFYKLRLFDQHNMVIYSSQASELGKYPMSGAIHELMVQGKSFSKLERKGDKTSDGALVVHDVVETYLPIIVAGQLLGTFEVYTDVTNRASVQGRVLKQAGMVIIITVFILIVLIYFIMRMADKNICEQQRMEARVREAAMVFDASSEGIFMTDAAGVIRRVNPAFSDITGFTPEETVGNTPRILKSGRHGQPFYEKFWQRLLEKGEWEGEVFNRRKDGTIYPEWLMVHALRDGHGLLLGYVAQMSDVVRRRLTEEEVRYRANYDALTGLVNRSLLIERADYAIETAKRTGKGMALLFIDLDHFKQVNDTLGHLLGDQLLQTAARLIKGCVRSTDTVGRQGGDEFLVILPGIDSVLEVAAVAEKIHACFHQQIFLDDQEIHVTASIGVAVYPVDGERTMELLAHADLAMYRSKDSGRDAIHFFEPSMDETAQLRRRMENDLRHASKGNELTLHYQPIISARDGRMIGVESLMRWNHPERGWISPEVFIPLAEDIGLIKELGQWALELASRQLALWRAADIELYIAVNLSARQIPDAISTDLVLEILTRHGLNPGHLMLEITEGVLLKDLEKTRSWLASMREGGIRIALDDFGTGYSSLSYLRKLHLDLLKIDKSFVKELSQNGKDQHIVATIIAMSHALGMKVTAEGVETVEQQEILKQMGCDNLQGYLLSRPVTAERIPDLVKASGAC